MNESLMIINNSGWLSPFSLCTGVALVCGYALLGATWMIIKSTGRLQRRMIHHARGLLVIVSLFLIFVSIWTPLHSDEIYHRWYRVPNVFLLSLLPLLAAVAVYQVWKNLNTASEYKPFIYSIVVFLCAYLGIGISVYPYLIPHQVTLWEAAAPDSTLKFILIGVVIMLPILLSYTLYAYHLFRGKSSGHYH